MRRRRLLALAIAIVLVVVSATARLLVWPVTDPVGEPDAVVLFVGGRGERLETALQLVGSGEVPHLVIPNGTDPGWPEANVLCAGSDRTRVFCPTPDPDTTRGEARLIAELAAEHGWSRVAMVTSDYHLSRARMLLSRCYDGLIAGIGADPRLGPAQHLARIGHEWLGLLRAWVIDRSC